MDVASIMIGITNRSRLTANDGVRIRPFAAARSTPSGKRRRQDHADEHPVRSAAAGEGEIRVEGRAETIATGVATPPGSAWVHQHSSWVPSLSVAGNVFPRMEIRRMA